MGDPQYVNVTVSGYWLVLHHSSGYRYYYYFRVRVGDLQYVNVTVRRYWSVLHHSDGLVDTIIIIISGWLIDNVIISE